MQEVLDVPSCYNFQVIAGRGKLGHGYSLGGINRFGDLVTATLSKLESVGPSTKPPAPLIPRRPMLWCLDKLNIP